MDTLPSFGRLAVLGFVLFLVSGSSSLAQAHKGKHGGHHQSSAVAKPAQAAPAPKPVPAVHPQQALTPHAEAHPRPTLDEVELLASLHQSREHLTQAGQDDRGRRTRALHQVNSAINLLSTQAGSTKSAARSQPPVGGETAGPEPESSTENHLSEAQRLLEAIEAKMPGDGVNALGYVRARASIQNAIRELNLALVDR